MVAYAEALRGISTEAIVEGVRKFLRGECEGVSTKYVPTPPELARIVRTAVIPQRVPVERQIEPYREQSPREKARMRLKMPLYTHAMKTGQVNKVAEANSCGFEAMAVLALEWNIPIPSELTDIPSDQAEREWRRANNVSWSEIERNPPPFMCHRTRAAA